MISVISDVYEIREYIPEILLYEKQIKERVLVFKYNTDPRIVRLNRYIYNDGVYDPVINKRVLDLDYTLNSIKVFFKMYRIDRKYGTLIDKDSIKNEILPSLNKVIKYIKG